MYICFFLIEDIKNQNKNPAVVLKFLNMFNLHKLHAKDALDYLERAFFLLNKFVFCDQEVLQFI